MFDGEVNATWSLRRSEGPPMGIASIFVSEGGLCTAVKLDKQRVKQRSKKLHFQKAANVYPPCAPGFSH